MATPKWSDVQVGDSLPSYVHEKVTRTDLVRYAGASESRLVFNNTDQYGTWIGQSTSTLGAPIELKDGTWSRANGGGSNEWNDGEWYEYIIYSEIVSPTHYRIRWWKRQRTQNGQLFDGPWDKYGGDFPNAQAGSLKPSNAIALGDVMNKSPVATQYIYWGPWEVVDGTKYPNPYGIAHHLIP